MIAITAAPGRSCGQCSLCCKLSGIGEPLHKPSGVWCTHCRPGKGGCSIYETRPLVCRGFICLWLQSLGLDDRWKPTTAKLYVATERGRIAVYVDPAFPNKWRQEPYFTQIKKWATDYFVEKIQVVVYIKDRAIVVLPDKEVDLGYVSPKNDIIRVVLKNGELSAEVLPAAEVPEDRRGKWLKK